MTTTVIYICDRCKKPQQTRQENGGYPPLWVVGISCVPIDHRSDYLSGGSKQEAEWCRTCVDELGIMKPLLRGTTEEKAPTIEDMVRDIVRKEQQGE